MRELVHAIDTHVDMVDLKVTGSLHATVDGQGETFSTEQPTENVPTHHVENVAQLPSTDPSI